MANNYLQTSFILDCKTRQARDDVFQFVQAWQSWDGDESEVTHPEVRLERGEYYNTEIRVDIDGHTTLWFYGEEGFDTDFVELVLSYAIKKHKLDPMGFTWACTCSKMRVDEFDGGAMFFKYDPSTDSVVVDSISGWSWVREKISEAKRETV